MAMYVTREDLEKGEIFLYGAGNTGKKLYRCLDCNGIRVRGFIDRRAEALRGGQVEVFSPDDPALASHAGGSMVILSGLFGLLQEREIRSHLEKRGFSRVYALRELEWKSFRAEEFLSSLFIGDFRADRLESPQVRQEVEDALALFPEGGERDYIRRYLDAHRMQRYGDLPAPLDLEDQYLAKGLGEALNLECFVDAGAFDGDVLRRFQANGFSVGTYIAFEPQVELCHRIRDTVSRSEAKGAVIFPCGLSDTWESQGFSVAPEALSASRAEEGGEGSIPCVPLDEALSGMTPTFIKMDIEGMEKKALAGAARTIRRCHPGLAVCVYHELSHIWEIPLYLKSLHEGYRFHIHQYQYMGLETVVYAFP